MKNNISSPSVLAQRESRSILNMHENHFWSIIILILVPRDQLIGHLGFLAHVQPGGAPAVAGLGGGVDVLGGAFAGGGIGRWGVGVVGRFAGGGAGTQVAEDEGVGHFGWRRWGMVW